MRNEYKLLKEIDELGIKSAGKNVNKRLELPPEKSKKQDKVQHVKALGIAKENKTVNNNSEIIDLLSEQIEIDTMINANLNLNNVEEEILNSFKEDVEMNGFKVETNIKEISMFSKIKKNKVLSIIIVFLILYIFSKGALNIVMLIAPLLPVIIGICVISTGIMAFIEKKPKIYKKAKNYKKGKNTFAKKQVSNRNRRKR